MFMRVSLRFLFGRRIRDKIFRATKIETLEAFLKRINFPKYLTYILLVKETEARIRRNFFRHEPLISSFLINKRGSVFVDVGAGFGYYSFLLYDNFETILTVEPHPDNVKIINAIKTEYNYSKVEIYPLAIGDKDDNEVKLFLGSHLGGHRLLTSCSELLNETREQYIKTKMVTLKTLLKDYEKVDLIKVDVEGAEWLVLEGAKRVLDKIRSWMIELHDLKRKEELERWFINKNYHVEWIDENRIYAESE